MHFNSLILPNMVQIDNERAVPLFNEIEIINQRYIYGGFADNYNILHEIYNGQ